MSRLKSWIAGAFVLWLAAASIAQDKGLHVGLIRASKAIGADVRSAMNENLGDIEDLVLDQDAGTIAYAVLSFGGLLGVGDKLFAVPWSALKPTVDRKAFTLDVPKEKLEKAPGFDKKDWPDVSNRSWGIEVHKFYGVPPYWEVRVGAVVAPASPEAPKTAAPQLKGHTGKVKTFERSDPALVVVESEGGDISAELAPPAFLEQQIVVFAPGDAITVRGSDVMRDGRKVFVVTEVTTKDRRTIRLRQDDLSPVWTQLGKKDGGQSAKK